MTYIYMYTYIHIHIMIIIMHITFDGQHLVQLLRVGHAVVAL